MQQRMSSEPGVDPSHTADVLIAHNAYQQPGGEDAVVQSESKLLQDAGLRIVQYSVHNKEIEGFGRKLRTFAETPYSGAARSRFEAVLDQTRPKLVHIHNYFPLLTPSIFFACQARRTPVVHTVHNYRSICPGGLLLRHGRVCEACVGRLPLPGIVHRCYRNSLPGSIAVAGMIALQRQIGWSATVSRYIALTEFARGKLIEGGFPADRILVKPNSVADPGVQHTSTWERSGALFVGRLSSEKGLSTVLEAWRSNEIPLRVAGDGPLANDLKRMAPPHVTFLGSLSRAAVYREMRQAAFLVLPSLWYEGFPMTLVEAYAFGLPVLASRIGSLQELVSEGETGLFAAPGDTADWAAKSLLLTASPQLLHRMSAAARQRYESRFTSDRNLKELLGIYAAAGVPLAERLIESTMSSRGCSEELSQAI